MLKEAVPAVKRVAVLFHPTVSGNVSQQQQTQLEAKALGIEIFPLQTKGPDDLESVSSALTATRAEALIVLENPMTFVYRKRIMELVARNRVPVISDSQFYPPAGALMSYSVDMSDQFHRAATYVDKIIRGAKPGDLPVEQPTKFQFSINLRTARELGLTIPQSLLVRADEVIQ